MSYIFEGSLSGFLCEDCKEPLSGVEVLLYLPYQPDKVLANTVASTKETFSFVTKQQADKRKNLLIATAKTNDDGRFEITLDEKYSNTAFDVDFICGSVPRKPPVPPRKEPLQFHLTTIFPQWRPTRVSERCFYKWNYIIAPKSWCYIRGHYFDAWVICGHLRACQTGAVIPNAKVTAWDADFFTDDNLGFDITDASGHFRIDYTSLQFQQTFLSPLINVETDPGPSLTFNSGPDVYFKATLGGATIINETAANRRNNVDYCLYVDLCSNVDISTPDPVAVPAFLRFGGIDYDAGMQSNTGQTGLTNSNYAFFSSLRLNGILSQTLDSAPMEYCFEYTKEYDILSGLPINWKRVLGGQIDGTNIGYVEKAVLMPADIFHPFPWYQYNNKDCVVNGAASATTISVPVAADGWILVPQQNDNPLNTSGVGKFVSNGNQIVLNSVTLDAFTPIDLTGLVAGNSVTSTSQPFANDEVFAIRMLVRKQGDNTSIADAGTCERVAINNTDYNGMIHHPEWGKKGPNTEKGVGMIDILQLQMAGCSKITTQVDVLYTFAHPNPGAVSVTLTGPLGDEILPVPLPLVPTDSFGNITHVFAPADPLCAYLVTLKTTYLLTTGDSNLPEAYDQIAFCR